MDLQYSREDRLVYYLSSVISLEDARKVYKRLDELADVALIAVDKEVYNDLAYDKLIIDRR